MINRQRRILIVGSGIAGLISALRLSEQFEVFLITKCELGESNTRWAQGGIAAAMFPDDSPAQHAEDTLRAGAGLCSREAVEILCSEGPQRIRDLIQLGVEFDQRNGGLARGLEAAHSLPRVLHAQGDATGLSIETALVQAVRGAKVAVLEHTFASDLLCDSGRAAGLKLLNAAGNRQELEADAVILASGGAGHLYQYTTNPAGATGDGAALALRAGAQLADLEFYQFHPTALALPQTFLISEAVRGEGAFLLDIQGSRFMQTMHPDAELAPRDVVARGIAMQMSAQNSKPVFLDATHLGEQFLAQRFPSIDLACRSRGLNWAKDPIPVSPAAHYWMGGIRTDLWGRTSVPGLFAIGEVACTGAHGANRLASNSLLESLVFAWRCARYLLEEPTCDPVSLPAAYADTHEIFEPTSTRQPILCNRAALQQLMWNSVGIERSGDDLLQALAQLQQWRVEGTGVQSLETANLLQLAHVTTRAALSREESRGAHYRSDRPDSLPSWERSLTYAQKVPVLC